ncbi:MAG: hypothetical protein KDE14_15885, partial [Rhodobacteraceae bacterium]|nr:hypothetical protein [Paracoccaceae bacterium]
LLAACASTFNLAQQEQTCGEQTETFRAFGDCMKTAVAGSSKSVKPGSRQERFMRMVDVAVSRYEAGVVDLDAAMREYVDGRAELQAEEQKANDDMTSAIMSRLLTGGVSDDPSQESVHAVAAAMLTGETGTYGSPGSLGTRVTANNGSLRASQPGELPITARRFGNSYTIDTSDGPIGLHMFGGSVTIDYPNGTSEQCRFIGSFLDCD